MPGHDLQAFTYVHLTLKNDCELPALKRIKLEPMETPTVPEDAVKCKVKADQEGSSEFYDQRTGEFILAVG